MLIVGAGVQGVAHLEAFAQGLGVRDFRITSRSHASAQALAQHAQSLGLNGRVVPDADAALADCPLAATCTPGRRRGAQRPAARRRFHQRRRRLHAGHAWN